MLVLKPFQAFYIFIVFHSLTLAVNSIKLTEKCENYLCRNTHRLKWTCVCAERAEKKPNTRLCAEDDFYELMTIFAEIEKNSRFERVCGEVDLSIDKDDIEEPDKNNDNKVRVKRLRTDESLGKVFKYKEYPRGKTNITLYHQLYAEAYTKHMEERIVAAVYSGTAIEKFSKESRGPSHRTRRSTAMFDRSILGYKSIFYYDIYNAPGGALSQESVTIAAALSDWAAKAPFCFRERVSSQEPPADFSIDFLSAQRFGNSNEQSKTTSTSVGRQVQLNKFFSFITGNANPGVPREVSLDAVMLHEAGHLLGVPHGTNPVSCSAMYTFYNPNDANNLLGDFERVQVKQLYGSCYGTTDAMTNIRFAVNGVPYTTTFICRQTAIWEYSYDLDRAIGNPIRTDQMFSGINNNIDAMLHIDSGPAERFPLIYVFKGTQVFSYRYDYNNFQRMVYVSTVTVYSLSRSQLTSVNAAFWSDDASQIYLFSGNRVCIYDGNWMFVKCNKINFRFPGLTNSPIDAAYQMPKATSGTTQCVFFRGNSIYTGEYSPPTGWFITYSGNVPNQSAYVWQDLCENLC